MFRRLAQSIRLATFTHTGLTSPTLPARRMVSTRRSKPTEASTVSNGINGIQTEPPAATSITQPPVQLKRKASPAPQTPPRKRSTRPPITPTPSVIGTIAEPVRKSSKNARVARLADPAGSNATLVSPESSRLITSRPLRSASLSPTKPSATPVSASPLKREALVPASPLTTLSPNKVPSALSSTTPLTTENLLDIANAHLISIDPRMQPLVEQNYCRVFSPEGLAETIDPFESLASGIISQQVSGAAAKSIKRKFIALFDPSTAATATNAASNGRPPVEGEVDIKPEIDEAPIKLEFPEDEASAPPVRPRFPAPSQVVTKSVEFLRTAGLSQRKAEYVITLAEAFTSGGLTAQALHDLPYEDLLATLIKLRGLGQWSVEMFACFGLKHMDVFSLGDLGIQRGMAAFEGRDIKKLKAKGGKWKYMTEKEMSDRAEAFRPYRSLFMWYMWRVEETDISTME